MKERIMAISFVSALSMILALTSGSAIAGEGCRGLDRQACAASTACRWIKGYQRSDGRKVAPYCRKVPAKRVVKESRADKSERG